MNQELKRLTLTRKFWDQGFKSGFKIGAQGGMIMEENTSRGYFFGRAIDTLENEMTYHRLTMDCTYAQNTNIQISLMASDSAYIFYEGSPVDTDAFLADPRIGHEKKLALFKDNNSIRHNGTTDVLLHSLKGRYLWICLSVFDMTGEPAVFRSIAVEFVQKSFAEYLPAVYREDDAFLKRYLGIFQSIYMDMERNIDKLPRLLDPDTVSGEILDYLGSWLGVENEGGILSTEQFRQIVKNAIALNKAKGTVWSLSEMVKLYTGEEPYIVEFFELKEYAKDNMERERTYNRIYTDNPYTFCIILKNGAVFERGGNLKELTRLVEKIRPAHTIARIIVLSPQIRLDLHSYIGINSILEKRSAAIIHERARMDGSMYLSD